MKQSLTLSLAVLFLYCLGLQSCAVGAELVSSTNYSITHEHRVDLPATLYAPGGEQMPMFERRGEKMLAISRTKSGKNEDNDPNPDADPSQLREGLTRQKIAQERTFSIAGGYALTDRLGLTARLQAGQSSATYRPYIESWNLTENVYNYEYWAGIPLGWDQWQGGTWYSTDKVLITNDYQRIGKTIHRSYRYVDGEAALGRYVSKNEIRAGLYGGLGFADSRFQGHLEREYEPEVYGQHHASLFKVFALPAASFHRGWLEIGASLRTTFLHYNLNGADLNGRRYAAEQKNLVVTEPAFFLRLGPRYCQLYAEQKFLVPLSEMPFPTNRTFGSVGVMSTF